MAANRKLQGEIDRTLKKVQEGVELFDEIWEKVYGAQNQNQKEKFESELKSQIKKLQRYRDDIKTWITNSDIKDKRPLTDARKLIETEMERFKVCEKEFKTKAFSKEGLSQATKLDPKEQEKVKVRKWIGTALETLSERKDVYEAELETINSAKKKKKDSNQAKWEDLIERCKYHEERLELVLRLIDNDSLSAEDVENIREQLEYLIEQMAEGNYDEVDGIDDDSIYEELGLDELAQANKDDEEAKSEPAASSKAAEKTPDKKMTAKEKAEEEKKEKEKKAKEKAAVTEINLSINAAALKAKPVTKEAPPVTSAKVPAVKEPSPITGAAPVSAALKAGTTAAAVAKGATAAAVPGKGVTASVPLTAAAAAAGRPGAPATAAAALAGGARPTGGLPPPGGAGPTLADAARGRVSKEEGAPTTAAAALLGGKPAPSAAAAVAGGAPAGGLPPPGGRQGGIGGLGIGNSDSSGLGGGGSGPGGLPPPGPGSGPDGSSGLASLGGGAVEDTDDRPPSGALVQGMSSSAAPIGGGAASAASHGVSSGADASNAGVPEDLESYEEILSLTANLANGSNANRMLNDEMMTRNLLSMSLLNKPEPSDSERPRTYVPRNPYPTPNSFPQTPAAVFDAPSTFDKFDTDTLFFIFYYQQGTYQQYLAARELKKQSWRYHQKYLTWFQRHEEPKVTAEDYEQGTYVYFDYETGWCQRIKSDFTFEYGYLEDELAVAS